MKPASSLLRARLELLADLVADWLDSTRPLSVAEAVAMTRAGDFVTALEHRFREPVAPGLEPDPRNIAIRNLGELLGVGVTGGPLPWGPVPEDVSRLIDAERHRQADHAETDRAMNASRARVVALFKEDAAFFARLADANSKSQASLSVLFGELLEHLGKRARQGLEELETISVHVTSFDEVDGGNVVVPFKPGGR